MPICGDRTLGPSVPTERVYALEKRIEGFLSWFESRGIPAKKGKAYFLLGTSEPKARIKAYQTVGTNTEAIVNRLKSAGIECQFDWVPGNHFANHIPRAEKALEYLYKTK